MDQHFMTNTFSWMSPIPTTSALTVLDSFTLEQILAKPFHHKQEMWNIQFENAYRQNAVRIFILHNSHIVRLQITGSHARETLSNNVKFD